MSGAARFPTQAGHHDGRVNRLSYAQDAIVWDTPESQGWQQ